MLSKAIDALSYADIEALVTNSVGEGRTLDFKRDLIGRTDEDKREFLADVSSFANTAGGDLILGVEESHGMAVSIAGLELTDPDAEILRLESIVRAGLEPRLPRIEPRWIPGPNGRGVLVVRTPRSWAAPHRVIFRDHAKFYGRSSAGKYSLDVAELRGAFVNAEGIVHSIRRFRQEQIAAVEADETPVMLRQGSKLVFHIIPLSAFTEAPQISFDTDRDVVRPLGSSTGGIGTRHTLEGLISYSGREDIPNSIYAYTHLFRSGIIEAARAIGGSDDHGPFIAPEEVEWPILRDFKIYCDLLAKHSIEPPFYVFLSLLGTQARRLYMHRHIFSPTPTQRRDVLLFPEFTIDDPNQPAAKLLRPLFDLFWNAFGHARSTSFNKNGEYVGEKY
jgi:hypothetical protein